MVRWVYNLLMCSLLPAAVPLVAGHLVLSTKRRKTFSRRMGFGPVPAFTAAERLRGPREGRLWVHALSVGEVLSASPLLQELRRRERHREIWFSASTATGIETARKTLSSIVDAVFHYPYDLLFSVRRITGAVSPSAVIIVESDLWPNFLFEMCDRGVPVALVNARISSRSYRGYRRLRPLTAAMFRTLSFVGAQTEEDRLRLGSLGVRPGALRTTGNMKYDRPPPVSDPMDGSGLGRCLGADGNREIVVAGSTHPGEEEILRSCFERLRLQFPDLLLVVVPRDPERSESVCRIFRSGGRFTVCRSSRSADPAGPRPDVTVVDTMGLLSRIYGISRAAFVGGSLVEAGGHNPLEPAALAKPVVFGPHTEDFSDICRALQTEGGAFCVHSAEALENTLARLLKDPLAAERAGRRARRVVEANRGAAARNVDGIADMLAGASPGEQRPASGGGSC